jgi:pimeloyl-ACP methyl ester carboxylesterase
MLSCAPPAAPTFHDVRLESGLRLRYPQQGAPDGPVVFSRAEREALGRRIPGARVQIFAGTGHALHWEDPERFVGALLSFVNGIPGGVMVQC